ncbi:MULTISPECIES: hypothetical protein [Paenibacillus]|uniref:Uncharacterized protein n=1 Tax=Paenibacillus campinasensis TaxID=66347 RepID=A0A268EVX4_9BACL|nr:MULTISPECIES: hypothetical protein [Paenibacillus]MUG67565.1 hypothetical protein [Paenibacillus campinasensis]PAD77277.1 hypothetical protein CHH67_09715 [Paenibacillus campinasensis]PAK52079.1 hypothetical protein CHH75_12735 [Paenibacillus sp. 7541]
MKLYPELFLTPWHAGVLLVTVLALLALIIGKYDSKTIVKHTLVSSLIAYAFLTFVLMLVMQEPMYKKETMVSALDNEYAKQEAKWNPNTGDQVALYVGAFVNEGNVELLVYAGNYDSSQPFQGDITVSLQDHDNQEVFTKTYENITLQPGEKKQIERTRTEQPMDTYRFGYETRPYK